MIARAGDRVPALLAVGLLLAARAAPAQQVVDSLHAPPVSDPAFPRGEGPVVVIDEGHENLHVADGSLAPLVRLLERDGYVVRHGPGPFPASIPGDASVVVVANARGPRQWPPPAESAFGANEIEALEAWVRGGGALLLIADHMPFAAAAAPLAAAFGVELLDGYAIDYEAWDPIVFRRGDGTLVEHEITHGPAGQVDSVATFYGSAIRSAEGVHPILVLPPLVEMFTPAESWDIHEATPRIPAAGLLQGAVLEHGAGRVAVFAEAAMFTAQLVGSRREPAGMNHPLASQNHLLVRNLLRWLSRPPD